MKTKLPLPQPNCTSGRRETIAALPLLPAAFSNNNGDIGANNRARSSLLLRAGNVGQHRIPPVLLLVDERGGFISQHWMRVAA